MVYKYIILPWLIAALIKIRQKNSVMSCADRIAAFSLKKNIILWNVHGYTTKSDVELLKDVRAKFSNIDFCLKILPLKGDELVVPEM